jgi:RNA polymerase sigma-70 factor (ECF subfamily)
MIEGIETNVSIEANSPEEYELVLIARAQDGDRHAFGALVLQHREKVIQMVYRMCENVEHAQDIAQETFLRAWIHLPNYQPRSPIRNWLYRIASNATLDLLRRERETVDVESLPLPAPGESVEASFETRDRSAIIREAVLNLPPASRSVLVLREYEELSYREIAETLNIPIGTVMSRLSYARRRLSEALDPYMKEALL